MIGGKLIERMNVDDIPVGASSWTSPVTGITMTIGGAVALAKEEVAAA